MTIISLEVFIQMMKSNLHLSVGVLTQTDIPAVDRIFEHSIADAFEQEGLGQQLEDIRQEIEHKKQRVRFALAPACSDICFLVAKRDGAAVGVISFGPCGENIRTCTNHRLDHVGELGSLYVLPSEQNRGVGSAQFILKTILFYSGLACSFKMDGFSSVITYTATAPTCKIPDFWRHGQFVRRFAA